MKNIINIKTLFIIALITILNSCLKDNGPAPDYSNSSALVSFQYTGFSAAPFVAGILGTDQDTFALEVTLSVASLTLSTPVSATIALYPQGLDSFNTANQTSLPLLPDNLYTLPNGGVVTINPGQQIVNLTLKLAGDKIDFSKNYVLPLIIKSAQGATVATNLNTAIVQIKLKSIYAGNYTGSGARIRYNGTTLGSGIRDSFDVSGTISYGTVSVKEIDGQLADAGSGFSMALLVHDDQAAPYPVDVLPDPLVDPAATPTSIDQGTNRGQSTYDPTTKTFDLHFSYTTSALRVVNEQLVAQ